VVDAQGTLWQREANAIHKGYHLDGAETVTVPGKGTFVRDPHGTIVSHISAQDKTQAVKYGYAGGEELNEVTYGDGTVVSAIDANRWNVHDPREPSGDYQIQGKLTVLPNDGTLSWQAEGSAAATRFNVHEVRAGRETPQIVDALREAQLEMHRQWLNSVRLEGVQAAGSVETDRSGRVKCTVAVDGTRTEYRYRPDGRPELIKRSDDTLMYTRDGRAWYRHTR